MWAVSSNPVSTTPDDASTTPDVAGVDPEDLATTLRVLGMLHELPPGHEDIAKVKRAAGTMYNRVKKARRREARQAERGPKMAHDQLSLIHI